MIVVDASVWVGRLVGGDVHHEASRAWLRQAVASGDPMAAPAILLAEVAGAIARRTGEPETARRALALLGRVPTLRLVPVDPRLAHAAADLAARLGLRGADAHYVALASELGAPLATWDTDQRDRAGAVIETVELPA